MQVNKLAVKFRKLRNKVLPTRVVREVSSHFEYLENRSRGLDVTWQQARGDLLRIREQSLSRGASQSAVRRRWLSLCTVWPSHLQTFSLSAAILALGKARSRREANLGCRGCWQTWMMLCFAKKACTRAVECTGALWWWSWSARSVIVNATVTQYTSSFNGVSLPTD